MAHMYGKRALAIKVCCVYYRVKSIAIEFVYEIALIETKAHVLIAAFCYTVA